MATAKSTPLTLIMTRDKQCKGSDRYATKEPFASNIYVPHNVIAEQGIGDTLTMTIAPA